jgi:hypothetical protein
MNNPETEGKLVVSIARYISNEVYSDIMKNLKDNIGFEEPERFKERVFMVAKDM